VGCELKQVYKGILAGTGSTVAVLRLRKVLEGAFEAFKMEMEMMSQVYLKYVVALVGYSPKHDPILIYEYPDNGSLFDHLHGELQTSDLGNLTRNLCFDSVVILAEGFGVVEGGLR